MKGSVVIAGAGPGTLQHLTLGALAAIREAEVILYDALIHGDIVAQFPENAEKIFVGKRCGQHAWTQTMIISAMIAHALAGKKVLRLKGGDPAVFAHLAEEMAALKKLGIPVLILPGVTAALAAMAELNRPLTVRGGSRHVWITDGHSDDVEKLAAQLAAFPGTLVFYMAAARCQKIAQLLLAHGMPGEKPCALVENAGTPEKAFCVTTVAAAAEGALIRQTSGPGILVVGEVLQNFDHCVVEKEYVLASQR